MDHIVAVILSSSDQYHRPRERKPNESQKLPKEKNQRYSTKKVSIRWINQGWINPWAARRGTEEIQPPSQSGANAAMPRPLRSRASAYKDVDTRNPRRTLSLYNGPGPWRNMVRRFWNTDWDGPKFPPIYCKYKFPCPKFTFLFWAGTCHVMWSLGYVTNLRR